MKFGPDGHPIPEKQGLITAHIKPILLGDIKLPRLFAMEAPKPKSQVMADVDHPITKALMERLPRMSNPDLKLLRAMLLDPERGGAYSSSKQEDIDSWVGLVDLEINYRKKEGSNVFKDILHLFSQHGVRARQDLRASNARLGCPRCAGGTAQHNCGLDPNEP